MNPSNTASSSPLEEQGGDMPISTVYVGDNKTYLSKAHRMRCVFRNFESLPHNRGDKISSGTIRCHGHVWSLNIYPGGGNDSSTPSTFISAYLFLNENEGGDDGDCDSHGKIRTLFKFRIPSAQEARTELSHDFASEDNSYGLRDLVPRDDMLDSSKNYLVNGDFTIDVDIRVWRKSPEPWTPPKQKFQKDMLRILESQKYADATFIVQGETFPGHRNIIASRAPALEEFCQDQPPNEEIELETGKIDPTAFGLLLRFVYAGILPSADEMKENARGLLCTSDYCGCIALKHAAESVLVESLTADNAAELLVFADANSCALLKEAATDVFLANPVAVRASSGWASVKESNKLMDELVDELLSGKRDPEEGVNLSRRSVATLRRKLIERGLDADGSKGCLVKRLKGEQAGAD